MPKFLLTTSKLCLFLSVFPLLFIEYNKICFLDMINIQQCIYIKLMALEEMIMSHLNYWR